MDATATRQLDRAVVDDGIRWLNFFNGRVLSAEDLRTDHDAITEARRQLGRGIGAGVVTGLEVSEAILVSSAGSPILAVKGGLAFNEDGQALELRRDITVGLMRVDAPTGGEGADFSNCDVVLPGTTGHGVYVLTVGPAMSDSGKAVVAGLGNMPADCNTAYSVEGVRFRLFPVPLREGDLDEPELLENRIAYRLFGGGNDTWRADQDPNGPPAPPTLLEVMRASCFGSSDVPLALIHWEPVEGIRFVDLWSVRRDAARRSPAAHPGIRVGDDGAAVGMARFLQFQAQVALLRTGSSAAESVVASRHFEHLPPVGILPLPLGSSRGFDVLRFFEGLTARSEVHIEGAHVESLIRESFSYVPIQLAAREAIRLYVVRENVQSRVRRCVVFASGHLRYRADGRFDLAYWNFANYAERM